MTECIEEAKDFLTRRSEKIIEKAKNSNQIMTKHNQSSIEHRSQVLRSHVNKIEQIILQLATIIQNLQPYMHNQNFSLLNFMSEAKIMLEMIGSHPKIRSHDLQDKLLLMESHRCHYEHSMNSIWNTLSSSRRKLNLQRQINSQLRETITNLVTPICGFDDINTVIHPEKVKKIQTISDRLFAQQSQVYQEQNNIQQIKNIS